jgi:hypothetical protein
LFFSTRILFSRESFVVASTIASIERSNSTSLDKQTTNHERKRDEKETMMKGKRERGREGERERGREGERERRVPLIEVGKSGVEDADRVPQRLDERGRRQAVVVLVEQIDEIRVLVLGLFVRVAAEGRGGRRARLFRRRNGGRERGRGGR